MDYNDRWKSFLNENAFKEKKKKTKKEIIDSGNEEVTMEDEEDKLEEMSGMSGGSVAGYAGPIGDKELNESSLSRISQHIDSHDCAVITAFRYDLKDMSKCHKNAITTTSTGKGNLKMNKERNRDLKATLLHHGFGVTEVKGTFVENWMEDNAIDVHEDSLFVVNLRDGESFNHVLKKLGMKFCQDSILLIPKGGKDAYLYGTNHDNYVGLNNKKIVGNFLGGERSIAMTKVRNRPFVFKEYKLETISEHSNNTKWAISLISKEVMND